MPVESLATLGQGLQQEYQAWLAEFLCGWPAGDLRERDLSALRQASGDMLITLESIQDWLELDTWLNTGYFPSLAYSPPPKEPEAGRPAPVSPFRGSLQAPAASGPPGEPLLPSRTASREALPQPNPASRAENEFPAEGPLPAPGPATARGHLQQSSQFPVDAAKPKADLPGPESALQEQGDATGEPRRQAAPKPPPGLAGREHVQAQALGVQTSAIADAGYTPNELPPAALGGSASLQSLARFLQTQPDLTLNDAVPAIPTTAPPSLASAPEAQAETPEHAWPEPPELPEDARQAPHRREAVSLPPPAPGSAPSIVPLARPPVEPESISSADLKRLGRDLVSSLGKTAELPLAPLQGRDNVPAGWLSILAAVTPQGAASLVSIPAASAAQGAEESLAPGARLPSHSAASSTDEPAPRLDRRVETSLPPVERDALDVEVVLDALKREVAREYQRFYGR